ncbi:MAG TPA: PhoH family protein [Mycobacteriales bacterium]|jgi:phosphate starvation-inducible PhoH-like protein|nr:PhoH family protein [Mycobacteriales bacterium]
MADGTATTSTLIVVPATQSMVALLGSSDELLRLIERSFSCDIHVRGNEITLAGDPIEVAVAARLFAELLTLLERGEFLTPDAVQRSIKMLRESSDQRPADVLSLNIVSSRGRTIRPKTLNQKRYVDAIDAHTIIFGIGPAGTGKTYLAMAKAVQALQSKQVNRIILTRPAVEAGERLGFLPGTLNEKIDPYLRPLYDALHDMVDPESIPRLMAAGVIEVAPLAYMRGRAMPIDMPVLTPTGYLPIGQLQVGDLVVGSSGLPTPVIGVYPQGCKEVFRVKTQDGASVLACGDHLWQVSTRHDHNDGEVGRVVRTRDMIGRLRHGHDRNFELPLVNPVEFEPREIPLDPYALGLLLGDGCITSSSTPSFSSRDPELAEALEAAMPGTEVRLRGRGIDYSIRSLEPRTGNVRTTHPVTAARRALGLARTRSATKSVPQDYLFNSAHVRLAVLQGLLDTDGGPVTQQDRSCGVQYTTCSEQLRDDVVFLVQSLGGVAYPRLRPAVGRKPGGTRERPAFHPPDAHVLDIRLPTGLPPFRLRRKLDRYDTVGGGRPTRMIDEITPAGEAECVCIAVAAADSLYVTRDFIVTHNTLNDSFIVLDEAQNTSAEQMKMFLTRLGFGSKMVVTGDVTQVDLPAGTRSGLRIVQGILEGINDVMFCRLTSQDVVRHKLVSDIVDAYAKFDAETASAESTTRGQQGPRRQSRTGH